MRVAVLFSGGKDSLYTIQKLIEEGHHVKLLLTLKPRSGESWLFHHPCVELTSLQARTMGIPISAFDVEAEKEEEEDELRECIEGIRTKHRVDGIAAGAIASQYQKRRIEDVANRLGLRCLTPLWGMDQMRLLREQVESGLEAMVVAVAALGLDQRWLGRTLDRDAVEELGRLHVRYGLNPSGEGGEYETFVVDSELFRRRIVVSDFRMVWSGDRGHLEPLKVELAEKV